MMSESLNVIALISGGKDSFYSILHCIQNGHNIVALGNVYPEPLNPHQSQESHPEEFVEQDEEDLNSYMYQTVGHTIIPLYAQALGIPLYRQQIVGGASATGATYVKPETGIDETESLVPLLQMVIEAHPEANAVCSGAILSTYQRTRVESVALRLGLIPLSFLWKYPTLPPERQVSLLEDMASVGLDARLIKVASWCLDESFLWQNVASVEVTQKIERAMARFGTDEDGAVLGEGGEFETLVMDGPGHLFKGRIRVNEKDRQVINGSANSAWLRIKQASVEMKMFHGKSRRESVRIPDLLSQDFIKIIRTLESLVEIRDVPSGEYRNTGKIWQPHSTKIPLQSSSKGKKWMIVGQMQSHSTVEEEVKQIMTRMKTSFEEQDIDIAETISTLILLRSMSHFAIFNKVYGSFFTKPNPPARVTIAVGDVLPQDCNVVIQVNISSLRGQRRSTDDLHVQSRSYWAPANIGPYSQSRSDVLEEKSGTIGLVHIAGQIPLVPATMLLPESKSQSNLHAGIVAGSADQTPVILSRQFSPYIQQAVLSLQHLWRVGQAMDVSYWTGAVAYLSKDTTSNIHQKSIVASRAWSEANGGTQRERDVDESTELSDEDEPDLWEDRYHMSSTSKRALKFPAKKLPDWSIIGPGTQALDKGNAVLTKQIPPFFAAEVEELPRGSDIEWQALLGVTHGPIKQSISTNHKIGSAFKHVVVNTFSQTFVFMTYAEEIRDLAASLDMLLAEVETPEEAGLRSASFGYYRSHAAYLDVSVIGLWNTDSYVGVIPCRSLWGDEGQRLAAVLIFQSFLDP